MDTSSHHTEPHSARSPNASYTPSPTQTTSPPVSRSPLIEDFEVSYVRTIIEDGPLQLSSDKSGRKSPSCIEVADDYIADEDLSEVTELEEENEPGVSESANPLRVKISLASTSKIQDSDESRNGISSVADDSYWDEHDPTKKWHFEGKAYSRVSNAKEHFYCQMCEDDGNMHHCFKRREMERHLRRMDHLPPELFCKAAKAVCPCPHNRAFTRIDGRKRHIKISIEHARKDAQSRKANDEVEKWQKHMKLLETTRGR